MNNDISFLPHLTWRSTFNPWIIALPFCLIGFVYGLVFKSFTGEFTLFFNSPNSDMMIYQIANGFLLLLVSIFGALFIMFTMKRNLKKYIFYIFSICLIVSILSVSWVHGYIIRVTFFIDFIWVEIVLFFTGILLAGSSLIYLIKKKGGLLERNATIFALSVLYGTIFGITLSFWAFLVFANFLAVFDFYSVFKGPIKKMMDESDWLPPAIIERGQTYFIDIGIGDLVLYGAVITFSTKYLGFLVGIIVLFALIIGVKASELGVRKYGKFPGLTFPVILSSIVIITGYCFIM